MTDTMNTFVSAPGAGPTQAPVSAAPGAQGPGAQMPMAGAILWVLGGAVALGVGTAYVARKGVRPEIGRFDVLSSMWIAANTVVWLGTFKLVAYKFHGHKISQAVLTII